MNAEGGCGLALWLVQGCQRGACAEGEFDVEGVVGSQVVVTADGLDRTADSLHWCVVEDGVEDSEGV